MIRPSYSLFDYHSLGLLPSYEAWWLVLNIGARAQKSNLGCKRDFLHWFWDFMCEFLWSFSIICIRLCYDFVRWKIHLQKVGNWFDPENCQVIIFDFCFHSSCWLHGSYVANETLLLHFHHVLITKFHLITMIMRHTFTLPKCGVWKKSEKSGVYAH